MRTEKEINKLLEKLCEYATGDCDTVIYEKAAIAAQALAWVLDDNITPLEMLEN